MKIVRRRDETSKMSCSTKKETDPRKAVKELKIVLLGKLGVGKSASGNTILGIEGLFPSREGIRATTKKCQSEERMINNQKVVVVDTPGLSQPDGTDDEVMAEIKDSIFRTDPGPVVFLLVLRMEDAFTEEEIDIWKTIRDTFGKNTKAYTLILFTTDEEKPEEDQIDHYIRSNKDLLKLIRACNWKYHVFDNDLQESNEVPELLEKMSKMVLKAGGCYTPEMLEEAETEFRKRQERDAGKEGKPTALQIAIVAGVLVGCLVGYLAAGGGTMTSAVGAALGAVAGGLLAAGVAGLVFYAIHRFCPKKTGGDWL